MNKFHQLPFPVTHFHLPEKFTYPFHYTPHPLCVAVAAEVQKYLQNKDEWKSDLEQGKMFGVLIVTNPDRRDRLSGRFFRYSGGKKST